MYLKVFLSICILISSVWGFAQPNISFTFDDGSTLDMPGYEFDQWNQLILDHLNERQVRSILFVRGGDKATERGKFLLSSWNNEGHSLGNHTVSHINYSSNRVTYEQFKNELLVNDTIISGYSNYIPLFRFPYLKEGDTEEKIASFRAFMREVNYKNGYVTIDASDWYIDSRLRMRLREDPQADIEGYRQYYLKHLLDRALFYEKLAFELTGRHIKHTLLLHHNLAAALFLDDLIEMFRHKGWNIVGAKEAFEDPIFDVQPTVVPAGESLIWALAKQSGRYEHLLRYPAEDGRYEKEEMDKLGL